MWLGYVILPLFDYLLPVDHENIPDERVRTVEKDRSFLIPLYAVWIMDVATLVWLLNGISNGTLCQTNAQFVLFAMCGAQFGGLNAVVGHELIHRKSLVHKILGTLAYSKMLYSHFFI